MRLALSLIALATAAPAAAQPNACPAPRFEISDLKVADDGRDHGYPGGISLADVDGDGDLDLLATRGYDTTAQSYKGDASLLYINDGKGRFTRRESPFSDGDDTPDSGATFADVDGDGDLDAYVSVQIRKPNKFFRNLGSGRFALEPLGDATADGLSDFSSSFVDIDGDGDLDLYTSGPTLERAGPNQVFRNDAGRFVAVTGTPINNGARNPGASLWGDLDNDGDLDLFVANSNLVRLAKLPPADIEHALVYRNEGPWRFALTEGQAFANPARPALAAALGDVDNDGDLDLLVGTHVLDRPADPDFLYLNDGRGRFSEGPAKLRPHANATSGAAFGDFNGDGALDLVTASYGEPIEVYQGDGRGGFAPVDDPVRAARKNGHWSAVTGDLDGDGRLDAVVGTWAPVAGGEYATVMMNRTPRCGGWVRLVLRDRAGAPDPPGARVTLVTTGAGGELRQLREASAQTGFRSQSGDVFLFAVPPGRRLVRAEVRWPDGASARVTRLKPGGLTEILR